MKEGQRPKECSICWGIEDLPGNQYSDRHYRGVESWTLPFFEKVKNMHWDEDINPTYLEVSWSSACNFKCMYCSPAISTEWMKEVKALGSYKLSSHEHQYLPWLEENGHLPMDENSNPYIEAFWKWWPDLVKDLMFFRITGGEPLLSRHTFKTLEWLNENPQPHLELSINSNLGVPQKQFDRFMTLIKPLILDGKIKKHILHTSLDTWGPQAEYIRNGLKLEVLENYLNHYLTEIPTAPVAFMCTFNILSIPNFKDFLSWILKLRTKFNNDHRQVLLDLPHLQSPEFFAAKIISPDYYHLIDDCLDYMKQNQDDHKGFKKAEIQKMNRIYEWIKAPKDKASLLKHRKDFYLFFKEHDKRRGTDFSKTFPELQNFLKECEQL